MSDHEQQDVALAIRENKKLAFPLHESSKSRISGKLRYWWCWAVAGTLLLVVGMPALLIFGIINKKMWIYPITRWGANLWLKACGATVKVSGKEHLPADESFVFISNHRSYLDTATLFFFTGRKLGLVAKKELLKVPVLGQGMHYVNIFAIDRSNPEKARRSMEKARKVLESGYSFGVFAEGTRAMPGELLPFKKGAFHLALQTGARIVPVAIKNTDWMMGKKTGAAYAGTVEMALLPPIETAGRDVEELLRETRGAIAAELAAL
ncbi:MAG TPA: lysophospholipid acyltransferase family protein [Pyrinomonadaceae bacterium]|nr:lysophospholipid acyltransferase family protein [Pyrinomonadaceae bacterium]HMP64480.1 lysophospholipid acyltransferase family protein [Pyrinomonadaceae bacterium]